MAYSIEESGSGRRDAVFSNSWCTAAQSWPSTGRPAVWRPLTGLERPVRLVLPVDSYIQ